MSHSMRAELWCQAPPRGSDSVLPPSLCNVLVLYNFIQIDSINDIMWDAGATGGCERLQSQGTGAQCMGWPEVGYGAHVSGSVRT